MVAQAKKDGKNAAELDQALKALNDKLYPIEERGLNPTIETLGIGTLCRERDCEWQNERLGGIPKHSGRWRSSG
jgi:hypothetical protein